MHSLVKGGPAEELRRTRPARSLSDTAERLTGILEGYETLISQDGERGLTEIDRKNPHLAPPLKYAAKLNSTTVVIHANDTPLRL